MQGWVFIKLFLMNRPETLEIDQNGLKLPSWDPLGFLGIPGIPGIPGDPDRGQQQTRNDLSNQLHILLYSCLILTSSGPSTWGILGVQRPFNGLLKAF